MSTAGVTCSHTGVGPGLQSTARGPKPATVLPKVARLAHSRAHLLTNGPWLLSCSRGRSDRCDRDTRALYGTCLPASDFLGWIPWLCGFLSLLAPNPHPAKQRSRGHLPDGTMSSGHCAHSCGSASVGREPMSPTPVTTLRHPSRQVGEGTHEYDGMSFL